jgi:hypothetical protein
MQIAIRDRVISKILGFGAAFTTIFVVSSNVTDPVNTPKMLVIGVIAFSCLGILLVSNIKSTFQTNRYVSILLILFAIFMLISALQSKSPFSQNVYGMYGRNSGLVTYISLSLIMFAALSLRSPAVFKFINQGLLIAGLVNIVYCFWVIAFGDFIGWSNPYGNILGTLGNPNFIGSFLGIFFTAYIAHAMSPSSSSVFRISTFVVVPVTFFEIVKSHAIQGRVVAVAGIAILGFLWIRSKFSRLILIQYSGIAIVFGSMALLGALKIGPLTSYIYKTSVSLRGQYWLAGWNTGSSHPYSGVGLDAFGDWYRRSRDLHALELPGVNTVVNAAHNVPLDIFASGGWPLFAIYLFITGWAGISAVKVILRNKSFDSTFAIMVIAWTGYQLQSIISINQVGLAIWGWLYSGCIIAYEQISNNSKRAENNTSDNRTKLRNKNVVNPIWVLSGSAGALVGIIIAIPPLTADSSWRSAQVSQSLPKIESSMAASYFNPPNSNKYLVNIQILENSNFTEVSHKYALEAVRWNPEVFELWKTLYFLKNTTEAEKNLAVSNMKRLDPLNPDVTSTQ